MPEWLKGTGCKPVGYAYVGSNPTPSTTLKALSNLLLSAPCASAVSSLINERTKSAPREPPFYLQTGIRLRAFALRRDKSETL